QVDRREWINPELINLKQGTQTREESLEKIQEYADMMREDAWDWTRSDIVIYEDESGAYPSDGHHRIMAAIAAGVQIFAEVKRGSLRDAIWQSFASNKFHGLPLTTKDKNNRVRKILLDSEWQQMSDRAIAEHCGVSTPLVSKVRTELVAAAEIENVQVRKGKDGRSQNAKKSKPDVLVENSANNSLLEHQAIASVENSLPEQSRISESKQETKDDVAIAPIAYIETKSGSWERLNKDGFDVDLSHQPWFEDLYKDGQQDECVAMMDEFAVCIHPNKMRWWVNDKARWKAFVSEMKTINHTSQDWDEY
ncbi:MAG: hypothetical protein ACKPCM_03965, partial [Pseudanabaena sp.]